MQIAGGEKVQLLKKTGFSPHKTNFQWAWTFSPLHSLSYLCSVHCRPWNPLWGEKVAEFGNEETFLVNVCPSYNSCNSNKPPPHHFLLLHAGQKCNWQQIRSTKSCTFWDSETSWGWQGFEGFRMRTAMKITTMTVTVVMITMMMITTLQCAIWRQ